MDEQFYAITITSKSNGDFIEKRFTNQSNLEKALHHANHDYDDNVNIYLNKATMCFDGYLVNGEYIGKVQDGHINL